MLEVSFPGLQIVSIVDQGQFTSALAEVEEVREGNLLKIVAGDPGRLVGNAQPLQGIVDTEQGGVIRMGGDQFLTNQDV